MEFATTVASTVVAALISAIAVTAWNKPPVFARLRILLSCITILLMIIMTVWNVAITFFYSQLSIQICQDSKLLYQSVNAAEFASIWIYGASAVLVSLSVAPQMVAWLKDGP